MGVFVGGKLYEWQKAVTDEICVPKGSSKTVVVKAPRQLGKSFLCEQVLLYYAINYKCKSGMISPVLSQSRKVYKELVNAIYDSGIIKRKNETLLEIELVNGSTIFFKSAEMRDALRGETITGCMIWDEASYLLPEIAEYTLPWLQMYKANHLIVSTPRLKTGLFYQYFQRGIARDGNIVSIDWNDFDTSMILTPELKSEYAKVLTRNQYRSEIEGEFLDNDGMVFTNIDNCIGDFRANYNYCYMGIDFGSGVDNDYTSISVFNEYGEMVDLCYTNKLNTFQQIDMIYDIICRHSTKLKYINAENNSIGNAMVDLLIKKLNNNHMQHISSKINRWITSNSSKAGLVRNLTVALERGQILLKDDVLLKQQLGAYEATFNPKTQVVTYNGAVGINDDMVMSTMLAWDAYINKGVTGTYSISIVR